MDVFRGGARSGPQGRRAPERRLSPPAAPAGAGGAAGPPPAPSNIPEPVDTTKQAVRGGITKDSRTVDISSFDPHNTQSGGSSGGTVNYYQPDDGLLLRGAARPSE